MSTIADGDEGGGGNAWNKDGMMIVCVCKSRIEHQFKWKRRAKKTKK